MKILELMAPGGTPTTTATAPAGTAPMGAQTGISPATVGHGSETKD